MTHPLSNYRADIDGLRALAVLAVVLNHLPASWVPGGYVSVDVFFVISGCLITTIIHREMAWNRFTFCGFYKRLARRVFPALFAGLAATLAAGYFILLPSDYVPALRAALGTLFFASNVEVWLSMHEGFLSVAKAFRPASGFQCTDPIEWLCTIECLWAQGNISLYRDEHHLSIASAMALEPQLALELGKLYQLPEPMSPFFTTKNQSHGSHPVSFTPLKQAKPFELHAPRF